MKRLAAALLVLLALPQHAAAKDVSVGVLLNPGPTASSPAPYLYHDGNAQMVAHGTKTYVDISAVTGNSSGYQWEFEAPVGEELKVGVYDRTLPIHDERPGRGRMGLGGCAYSTGRFEVKDIAWKPDGTLQRIWVLYDAHCDNQPEGSFGEVRFGEPLPDDAPLITPAILRFSEGDVGRVAGPVPVTVIAPAGGAQVASATTSGASDFAVTKDDCSGKQVAAGGSCQVWVRFSPAADGVRAGTLRITEAGGRATDIPLQGWVHGGRTRMTVKSDPGEPIGEGGSFAWGPTELLVGALVDEVGFSIDTQPKWWGKFSPGRGVPIANGRYVMPDNGSVDQGPVMSITGRSRACGHRGEFTVRDLVVRDGYPASFGVDFVQICTDGDHDWPPLRGTIDWRVGDTTPPAPWMVSGARTAEQPQAAGTGQADAGGPAAPAPSAGGATTVKCGGRTFAASAVRRGTRKRDRLRGSKKSEAIFGGGGRDQIRAGRGNDCVDGGAGRDTIDCGAGRDTVRLGPGDTSKRCERKIRVKR